ncbi:peroxisome assembly protein 26 isoform X2 [Lissotriton helveticus]
MPGASGKSHTRTEDLVHSESSQGCEDVKTSLCIVGVQALAEMNRWREVFSWLLQYYEVPEKIPMKLLEMCILLYSKVEEPAAMLDVGNAWLRHGANRSLVGYSEAVKLFLLQVLLPLGLFEEAEELALDSEVFSEKQEVLLEAISERKQTWGDHDPMGKTKVANEDGQVPEKEKHFGSAPQRLKTLLNFLYRVLGSAGSCILSLPLKRIVLAALILGLLILRVDPAGSLSHPFLSSLVWMLRQVWETISPVNSRPGICR